MIQSKEQIIGERNQDIEAKIATIATLEENKLALQNQLHSQQWEHEQTLQQKSQVIAAKKLAIREKEEAFEILKIEKSQLYTYMMKHPNIEHVEVYLLEFKLTIHPNISDFKCRSFSRIDTVGDLEAALRKEFKVEKNAECRVWYRFMTGTLTYELLSNCSQTLQDAGLYNGQVNAN